MKLDRDEPPSGYKQRRARSEKERYTPEYVYGEKRTNPFTRWTNPFTK
jgi:hypothetical protein